MTVVASSVGTSPLYPLYGWVVSIISLLELGQGCCNLFELGCDYLSRVVTPIGMYETHS